MASLNHEDADSFLQKVKEVEQQVKGILDGSISIEEVDKTIKEKEMLKKYKEEQKKLQEEQKLTKGRKGKGHKGNYKRFCCNCFTEYDIEIEKCNN